MILGLETLRGLAALAVAFYHFPSDSLLFIQNGYMAVYLFFSLSGFVITLNYFKKIDNIKSLIVFQKKRFFRLYPVHFFVLILVLLIEIDSSLYPNVPNLNLANPRLCLEYESDELE